MNESPRVERKEKLNLTFKKATEADVDAFLKLQGIIRKAKTFSGIFDKAEALREFAETDVYLIYKDGTLVGSTELKMKGPDEAYLAGLVIHPDYEGQGIAREAALFRLNQVKDVSRVYLVTHPENEKIINLYQSLGFTIGERLENHFGDGEPRIVMTLKR
jgi:ribosomal protein S18 acetylase RimI-like enzyme